MHFPTKQPMVVWPSLFVVMYLLVQSPGTASEHSSKPAILSCGSSTLDFSLLPRDVSSFWITKTFGLPTPHVTHFTPVYSLMLLQQLYCPTLLTVSNSSVKDKQRRSSGTVLCRVLIILMLFISGNVHPNPGPASDDPTTTNLSFKEFCECKSLGFLHVNICSLLPKLDMLKSWVHTANPDVLAISESWLRKSVTNSDISLPGYNVFRQDRATRGGGVAMFVKDHLQCTVVLSKSIPKQFELLVLKLNLSTNFSLSVAACYRTPSAPACTLIALSELLAPHISSEFVLLGDLNWDMITPSNTVLQQFDALSLTQIISEPTRHNLKSPSSSTLIDIILTNTPSNYHSGVFSQSLSDHCAIACIRSGL